MINFTPVRADSRKETDVPQPTAVAIGGNSQGQVVSIRYNRVAAGVKPTATNLVKRDSNWAIGRPLLHSLHENSAQI